jgi:hypothetical protein
VNDVLQTVDGGDLALTALVGAAHDGDLVVLAEGDGADLFDGKVSLESPSPIHYWLPVLPVFSFFSKTRKPSFGQTQIEIDAVNVRCTSHGAPWRG